MRGGIDSIDMSDRVALQTAIAVRVDELRVAVDPALLPQTTYEWMTRLVVALGALGASHDEPWSDLQDALVDMGADVLLWLEDVARERRTS